MEKLKAEIVKDFFEKMQKTDYKKGSLKIVEWYFKDNIGLGEMNLDIVEIRGNWYVANTDDLTLTSVEDFAISLLECSVENGVWIYEWFEEFYIKNEKMINFFNNSETKSSVENIESDFYRMLKENEEM